MPPVVLARLLKRRSIDGPHAVAEPAAPTAVLADDVLDDAPDAELPADAAATLSTLPLGCLAPLAGPPAPGLATVAAALVAALDGVAGDRAALLHARIGHARSLDELWELRSALYGIVAVQFSQAEADRRVEALACHFPEHAAAPSYRDYRDDVPR